MADDPDSLKPGQKFPTPTPGFGDRVFYETLLRQRPDSFMAQEWCVSYGVLPYDEAERLFEIVVERKRSNKMSGGVVQSPMKTTKKPMKKVKKARLSSEEGFDPDMQVSSGDAVGRGSL